MFWFSFPRKRREPAFLSFFKFFENTSCISRNFENDKKLFSLSSEMHSHYLVFHLLSLQLFIAWAFDLLVSHLKLIQILENENRKMFSKVYGPALRFLTPNKIFLCFKQEVSYGLQIVSNFLYFHWAKWNL